MKDTRNRFKQELDSLFSDIMDSIDKYNIDAKKAYKDLLNLINNDKTKND